MDTARLPQRPYILPDNARLHAPIQHKISIGIDNDRLTLSDERWKLISATLESTLSGIRSCAASPSDYFFH